MLHHSLCDPMNPRPMLVSVGGVFEDPVAYVTLGLLLWDMLEQKMTLRVVFHIKVGPTTQANESVIRCLGYPQQRVIS